MYHKAMKRIQSIDNSFGPGTASLQYSYLKKFFRGHRALKKMRTSGPLKTIVEAGLLATTQRVGTSPWLFGRWHVLES